MEFNYEKAWARLEARTWFQIAKFSS